MTYLVPKAWVTRQEDYMRLDKVPASYDPGPWEAPTDNGLADAIEEEFDFLIRDPQTIENAFGEGIQIDAVAAAIYAQIADKSSPTFYEAVAKRIELSLRRKVWDYAVENVKGRMEP